MAKFKSSLEKMLSANIRQTKTLASFVEKRALLSLEKDKDKVIEMEKERLFSGKTFTGKNIEPAYTGYTVFLKEQKGQPTDRVTLKDKGNFYNSIELETSKTIVQLNATDEKTTDLELKYKDILGISDKTFKFTVKNIIDRVNPVLFKKLLQTRFL